ncbi:hypothetical protein PAXINDRAFT_154486 [Paxillus involutus ATCC 200175]|nr:hypothetical protein PAXINDRAFT_154486 [Paxillus involutus ATCC 200175]
MHETNHSIHIDVEGTAVPPHRGPGWTRFVCISDTHSRTYRVPSGDVLLHAGDLSSWGTLPQLTTTVEWLKTLDHPIKIYHECSVLLLFLKGDAQLCLDTKWGESDNWGFSPEVSPIKFNLPYGSSDAPRKVIQRARAYVHSQASFGMFYLEHRPIHVTSPTGRVWKLYGSPPQFTSKALSNMLRERKLKVCFTSLLARPQG